MKKIILFIMLLTIGCNIKAEEILVKVTYNINENRILAIIVSSKNYEKRNRCEELIINDKTKELIKKKYEKSKMKYAQLEFICKDGKTIINY